MSAERSASADEGRSRKARDVAQVPSGTPEGEYPRRMNCATAAQLLGISVSHLRRMTRKCPAAIRYGHRVTYDRDLLLAWNPRG